MFMAKPLVRNWGKQGTKLVTAILLLVLVLWWTDPGSLLLRVAAFPVWAVVGIILLLVGNLFLVSFRFWRVLAHFGVEVPWAVASRASIAGHAAGLLVISLFGQVAGRQAVLSNYGIPAIINSSLSAYERALLAFSSGTLCVLGAVFLLGQPVVMHFFSSIALIEIFSAWILAIALAFFIGRTGFEVDAAGRLWSKQNARRVLEVLCITAIGQVLVLCCFAIGIHALVPDVGLPSMLAAASVISFFASLPITVNGWGTRELASIFVLGHLGVTAADAVTVSIIVGLCSTIVIVLFFPFTLKKDRKAAQTHSGMPRPHNVLEVERTATWILSMVVAVSVLFQAHIGLPGGILNVNLADPLAVLALAALVLQSVFSRCMPSWRVSNFNLMLGGIGLLFFVGFMRGWQEVGITQWALGGRLVGWLVLMGYLSAGYLLISYFGSRGLRRFTETVSVAIATIVIFQGIVRISGIGINPATNFEGFAGNRNAFAFQLLTVMCFLLAYTKKFTKKLHSETVQRGRLASIFLLAIILLGLIWTGSRAGWGVGLLLCSTSWSRRWADRGVLVTGLFAALLVWGLTEITLTGMSHPQVQSVISNAASDQERWQSYLHAIDLWRESPLFGVGLGVFLARSHEWFSAPLVVHSIPLWILAEFGLLGGALFGWIFFSLMKHAVQARFAMTPNQILILLLLMIAVFGLVHEMLYQRIFWLALGVVLAIPYAHKNLWRDYENMPTLRR